MLKLLTLDTVNTEKYVNMLNVVITWRSFNCEEYPEILEFLFSPYNISLYISIIFLDMNKNQNDCGVGCVWVSPAPHTNIKVKSVSVSERVSMSNQADAFTGCTTPETGVCACVYLWDHWSLNIYSVDAPQWWKVWLMGLKSLLFQDGCYSSSCAGL